MSEPDIPPLEPGERRLIHSVRMPGDQQMDTFVAHGESDDPDARFVSLVTKPVEPEGGVWDAGPDERAIYVAVAEGFVNGSPPTHLEFGFDAPLRWYVEQIRPGMLDGYSTFSV